MTPEEFGTINKRGDYRPNAALKLPPWAGAGAAKLGAWLKSYLFGWNLVILLITLAYWWLIVPDQSTMAVLGWAWALKLLIANMVGVFLFFGAFEWRLYVQKRQAHRFKYNAQFPADKPSDVFWFRSQNLDNFLRSLFVTVPIGTLVEVLCLWAMASGFVPVNGFDLHPIWFVLLIMSAPLIHESYFFFIHWLIHQGVLYKYVHSVHHNSVNPSPWSSMSMHPIEGLLYFGACVVQLLLYSNPFILIWQWNIAAYGAVIGHIGFDKLEIGQSRALDSHAYAHYLHHKYFDVNYCDDGVLPWDKWFGTWHDGTAEGDRLRQERFQKKKQRNNKGTK